MDEDVGQRGKLCCHSPSLAAAIIRNKAHKIGLVILLKVIDSYTK